jgi:hypothetical protein
MMKLLVIVALFLYGSQAQRPWSPQGKINGETYGTCLIENMFDTGAIVQYLL